MTKPYDATSKDLIEAAPADWVAFLGGRADPGEVTAIDADLSAVTAAADKVIRVAGDPARVLHLEFQAGSEAGLPRRLLRYNALLGDRHRCPVATAIVLLRKEANPAEVTGELAVAPPVGPGWAFRYTVVRVWRLPADPLLTGGLSLLPLAPLADVAEPDLPAVVGRMKARLDREAPRDVQRRLWAATGLLMGLRYDEAVTDRLLEGVMQMEESTTYQALIRRGREQGRTEEARALVLRQGTKRFGPPPPEVEAAVAGVADIDRLEALADRLLDVSTWQDLLAGQ